MGRRADHERDIGPAGRTIWLTGAAMLGLSLAALGGCHKPLLSPRDERTPFDRYDAMRDQFAQQYVEDEFGRRQPNLRGRLSPKR